MKRTFTSSLLLSLMATSFVAFAEDANVKLYSFTVAEEAVGKTMEVNVSSTDKQEFQVDWGDGKLSEPVVALNYDQDWDYGVATGTVAGTTITVYGTNVATIDDISVGFNKSYGDETKILTLDISPLSALKKLNAPTNLLTELDLTGNPALERLLVSCNKITSLTLPEECALKKIEAQNTADLGENDLFGFDFSKAPNLEELKLSYNNKSEDYWTYDFANAPTVKTLIIEGCNLYFVEIPAENNLEQLTVNKNLLSDIDLSNVGDNFRLFALNNSLAEITLPEQAEGAETEAVVATLNIANNNFTFSTLPSASKISSFYNYSPQNPIKAAQKGIKVDLSAEAVIDNVETVYKWTVTEEVEVEDTEGEGSKTEEVVKDFEDYTIAGGITTFTKEAVNAVCTMTNEVFPKLTLTTEPITVKFPETPIFSFTLPEEAIGKTMEFGVSSTDEQNFKVDWGEGKYSEIVTAINDTWDGGVVEGTIAATEIKVIGCDPATINFIDLGWDKNNGEETKVLSLDITKLSGLTKLNAPSNNISELDLSGNPALENVSINSNRVKSVKFPEECAITTFNAANTVDTGDNDLFGCDFSPAKNLATLTLNFNNKNGEATTFDLSKIPSLKTFIATDCNLTSMEVPAENILGQLTINNNKIESIDLSNVDESFRFFALNNSLSEITMPEVISFMNISNNNFTFSTLPAITTVAKATSYTYAPQKEVEITVNDGVVDLSSEAVINGVETVYKWTVAEEVEGEKVEKEFSDCTVKDGITTFTAAANNLVCAMTNAEFPKLTLVTAPINVTPSSVAEIEVANGEAEYYNLQGVKVSGKDPGLYIRVVNGKAQKILVK